MGSHECNPLDLTEAIMSNEDTDSAEQQEKDDSLDGLMNCVMSREERNIRNECTLCFILDCPYFYYTLCDFILYQGV